jgi:DNA-binding transcriptional ArsR family regulator
MLRSSLLFPVVRMAVPNENLQPEACAKQLKALSEPVRLRIIELLRHGSLTVSDIAEFLEVELVTVSHHLGILKHAQLVVAERDGRHMVYSLRPDVLQRSTGKRSRQFLDFGCCRLELPSDAAE